MLSPSLDGQSGSSGWQAYLTLQFSHAQRRTLLSHRQHSGPLQVQRAFYPETDGTCHIYILHPPGGVVSGDRLTLRTTLDYGSQVLLTTPAANKFYRSNGAKAYQQQHLKVAQGAALEWLPQESIFFKGAQVHSSTRVELSGNAGFIGWEILCLGRPAAGESFTRGLCRQDFEVWRNGLPLYLERGLYEGGSELLESAWGLNGRPITASLICVSQQAGLVELIRSNMGKNEVEELVGVSQLDAVLVCRYLGYSAERAKNLFSRIWKVLRPVVFNKPACLPRIWNT